MDDPSPTTRFRFAIAVEKDVHHRSYRYPPQSDVDLKAVEDAERTLRVHGYDVVSITAEKVEA